MQPQEPDFLPLQTIVDMEENLKKQAIEIQNAKARHYEKEKTRYENTKFEKENLKKDLALQLTKLRKELEAKEKRYAELEEELKKNESQFGEFEQRMKSDILNSSMVSRILGVKQEDEEVSELDLSASFTSLAFSIDRSSDGVYKSLKNGFNSEPKRGSEKAIETWKKLGPIDIDSWIDTGKVIYDASSLLEHSQSKFGQVNGLARYENGLYIMEGHFEGVYLTGYGRSIFENGDYYIGDHLKDKQHGFGKLVKMDGTIQQGRWKNNIFCGA